MKNINKGINHMAKEEWDKWQVNDRQIKTF